MIPFTRRTTSGKGPRRDSRAWAASAGVLAELVDVQCVIEMRAHQAGQPAILRLRERDSTGDAVGGTAVLTLYSSGSWTWGGDADVVAYAREPLDRHGVLP